MPDAVHIIAKEVSCLSLRRPEFDPRPAHMEFVMDEVALGKVFLRVLPFFPLSIILLMLNTPSFIHH
jgi:hypothetical protein